MLAEVHIQAVLGTAAIWPESGRSPFRAEDEGKRTRGSAERFLGGDTNSQQRRSKMFQHILVPLDGSTRAEQALPVAARIARATGGSLLLVRVVPPPIDYSGGISPIPLMNEQM